MSSGFRPGPTQTGLHNNRRCLAASNLGYRKKRNCTIYEAKTKPLISCEITAQLICAFVFAYAKSRFSHDAAHLSHSMGYKTAQRCVDSAACTRRSI